MKRLLALVILFTPASVSAADLQTHKDLPYADNEDSHQKLDVYAPADARNCPVVVWIHGGGWRQGDKGPVQRKPQAFADKGCLFVSINYRLVPQATIKEMTGDVAKAIRWVHDHAREFGGDGNSLFVMGHSAGAHLAALVCTDDRYLKAEGLPLSVVKGCVPIDVSVYDVVKRREETPTVTGIVVDNFGKTADEQTLASPPRS
jgi:acetyl esterase/lipase